MERVIKLLHDIENAAFERGIGDIRQMALEALDIVDPPEDV